MKSSIERALRLLTGMVFLLVFSLYVLEWVSTDPNRYDAYQARLDVYASVGVGVDELQLVQKDMANSLKTGLPLYNRTVQLFDRHQPIFNEREMLHMKDVIQLFSLGRDVRLLAQTALVMLFAIYLLAFRKELSRRTPEKALTLFLALGCWVLLGFLFSASVSFSFERAFIRFHEILFTNDLWLLDPRTSAMIRMYPERFFMWMGRDIALWIGAFALGASALIFLIAYPWRRHGTKAN